LQEIERFKICLGFNSEELLGIQAMFSLMIIFKLSALRFVPAQALASVLAAALLRGLQAFLKL